MRYSLSVFISAVVVGVVASPLHSRGQQAPRTNTPAASEKAPVVFVEVPASESKITWVHDNGRSEAHHLPETCGGGGLFFDYDNDGWMDIYLVNSGPWDFFKPKTLLTNALYHNNDDGTSIVVRDQAGGEGDLAVLGAAGAD